MKTAFSASINLNLRLMSLCLVKLLWQIYKLLFKMCIFVNIFISKFAFLG